MKPSTERTLCARSWPKSLKPLYSTVTTGLLEGRKPSLEFGREDFVETVVSVDPPIDDDGEFTFLVRANTAPRRYSIR